jgi:hypothetical protein
VRRRSPSCPLVQLPGKKRAKRIRALRSDPEDCKPQNQQHQEDHDEDIEQEAGDVRRCSRDAGETEDAGDDRNQKEDQRPLEDRHRLLPEKPAAGSAAA